VCSACASALTLGDLLALAHLLILAVVVLFGVRRRNTCVAAFLPLRACSGRWRRRPPPQECVVGFRRAPDWPNGLLLILLGRSEVQRQLLVGESQAGGVVIEPELHFALDHGFGVVDIMAARSRPRSA
jgi:hypothetical protein